MVKVGMVMVRVPMMLTDRLVVVVVEVNTVVYVKVVVMVAVAVLNACVSVTRTKLKLVTVTSLVSRAVKAHSTGNALALQSNNVNVPV